VTTLIRLVVSFACALFAARSVAFAQTVLPGRLSAAQNSELDALLSALPKWNGSATVSVSYGYNDNLLLSFTDEERSPFVRGSVEVILMRAPRDQFEFSFFADTETTRYTAGERLEDDAKVWVRAEPGYRLGETLKFSLPVTGYYYDQVFDVSDTDVERLVAELKVKGVMVGPTVRWDFHPAWWMEAQAVAQRKRYDDGTYDGDIGEGTVQLGWTYGGWFEARLTGGRRWRDFETRPQYSAPAGRELPGTQLKIAEREGELSFDIFWDDAAHWKTRTRASLLRYRDNGSGYFNYREQKVGQELEWKAEPWRVSVGGSASRVDFSIQKVGLGIDPPARLRDEFAGEFQVSRTLSSQWTIYGGYTWERWRSNDPVSSYTVNEGLLGVRWSWEK
jgi:hypothetical protein